MNDETKRLPLSERLNQILEIQEEEKKQEIIKDFVTDKQSQDDFDYGRAVIKDMVERGQEAVSELTQVAKESDQARHYEVLAGLIKVTADNAEKLLDIIKKKKEIDLMIGQNSATSIGQGGTNNIFVGTTADVLKLIKDQVKTNQSPIIDVTPEKEE